MSCDKAESSRTSLSLVSSWRDGSHVGWVKQKDFPPPGTELFSRKFLRSFFANQLLNCVLVRPCQSKSCKPRILKISNQRNKRILCRPRQDEVFNRHKKITLLAFLPTKQKYQFNSALWFDASWILDKILKTKTVGHKVTEKKTQTLSRRVFVLSVPSNKRALSNEIIQQN